MLARKFIESIERKRLIPFIGSTFIFPKNAANGVRLYYTNKIKNPQSSNQTSNLLIGEYLQLNFLSRFSYNSLPEPMLSPHFIHFLNRNICSLRQQEVYKCSHYHHPSPKEEENPRFEAAKHRKKCLSNTKCEQKVHCHCNTLSGGSNLQRKNLTRNQPS